MDIVLGIFIQLVKSLIFGFASNRVASEKGYSGVMYFLFGFILDELGVALALCLKEKHAYADCLNGGEKYNNTEEYIKKLSK